MNTAKPSLLSLQCVSVQLHGENGTRTLLDGVSFTMQRGETLALVGESGSGKSLCAQTIMGILPRPVLRQSGGSIHFDGERIDNHLPLAAIEQQPVGLDRAKPCDASMIAQRECQRVDRCGDRIIQHDRHREHRSGE